VAIQRDMGTAKLMRIYIDGVLDTSVALSAGALGSIKDDDGEADPLQIGAIFLGGQTALNAAFEGIIDEVQYFNRSLSAAEIQSIYNAGMAGQCKP